MCNFQNYLFTTAKQHCLAPKGSLIFCLPFLPASLYLAVPSPGRNKHTRIQPVSRLHFLVCTAACQMSFRTKTFIFHPHGFLVYLLGLILSHLCYFLKLKPDIEISYISSLHYIKKNNLFIFLSIFLSSLFYCLSPFQSHSNGIQLRNKDLKSEILKTWSKKLNSIP